MSAGELKDLLSLNAKNTDNFSNDLTIAKRRKIDYSNLEDKKYSLQDLWDESQYEEQHNLETFMQSAGGVKLN